MSKKIAFAGALDAAEQLDAESQAELVAVLSQRLAESARQRVAAVVAGQCLPRTAAEVLREAQSCMNIEPDILATIAMAQTRRRFEIERSFNAKHLAETRSR